MEKQEIREIEQRCIEEEKNLIFDTFSQTEALKLGSFIYEKSKNCSGPVAIEIRINRLTVFSFFPDGTNENNLLWLRAKARTRLRQKRRKKSNEPVTPSPWFIIRGNQTGIEPGLIYL